MGLILPSVVTIQDVCPRDGLQILPNFLPTAKKLILIEMLEKAGCKRIEASAFVHPKWVAQMADSADVAIACNSTGIEYSYLVPNKKGMERAIAAGARELVFFLSASEVHNMSNVNKSVEDSLAELVAIAKENSDDSITMRVNLATAFGYEGEVPIASGTVENICTELVRAGYSGITLCDSTGLAEPEHVYELCTAIVNLAPETNIGLHLHQAHGREYACVLAGLRAGITTFDSAVGGLGGCPYAEGASGNIATEILCDFCHELGIKTNINLPMIHEAACFAKELEQLGR